MARVARCTAGKLPAVRGLAPLAAAAYAACLLAFGFRLRDFARRGAA